MKPGLLRLSLLVLTVAASMTHAADPAAAQGEPVRIGVVKPLTGQGGFYGQQTLAGINLAAEEINKAGGILGGRQIEIVAEDGKCLPSETVAAGKKLIFQDKVTAIIGALCSSATLALQQLTGENKIVHLTAISTSPKLTDPETRHKYYFRTLYSSEMMANALADYIATEIKPKTFAFVAVNDDYGRGEVTQMEARFKEVGGPEIVYSGHFEFGDTDFTSVLARLRSANPDGIYLVARPPQNVLLLKQMRAIGFTPSFLSGDIGYGEPKTIADAGNALNNLYLPLVYIPGMSQEPGVVAFEAAYEAKFGERPQVFTQPAGATALQAIAKAMDAAGTDTDTDKIAETIQAMAFDGPFGRVSFDANGQNQIGIIIGRIANGVVERIK